MSRYLSSIADKINSSPLATHLPSSVTHALGGQGTQAAAGSTSDAPQTGSGRHYALENLQHSFRSLQVQYSNQVTEEIKQIQLMITTQKGVALDFDAVSRDAKSASKELFSYGQKEKEDIKDVTDRLAYVNFVQGGLAATVSRSLDTARAPLKALRDAEQNIYPKRNLRKGVYMQIQQIKSESKSPQAERKVAELSEQLRRMEGEDSAAEKEIEILKRNAIRESEARKWAALREYGEKLVLLAKASENLLTALPTVPPTGQMPYMGGAKTASTRAALQRALDNYRTGNISLADQTDDPSEDDKRSFGETHASELSSIASASTASLAPVQQATPQGPGSPSTAMATSPTNATQPLDPANLNYSPAPLPTQAPAIASPVSAAQETSALSSPPESVSPVPPAAIPEPTVAETGIPVSGGAQGPGPSTGSLAGGRVTATNETASRGPLPGYGTGTGSSTSYESAEDEKKRLEREERERILHDAGPHPVDGPPGASSSTPSRAATQFTDADSYPDDKPKDDLPPYQPY